MQRWIPCARLVPRSPIRGRFRGRDAKRGSHRRVRGCRDDACGTSAAVLLQRCYRGGESVSAQQTYELVERERRTIQVGCLLREYVSNPGRREIHNLLDEAVG